MIDPSDIVRRLAAGPAPVSEITSSCLLCGHCFLRDRTPDVVAPALHADVCPWAQARRLVEFEGAERRAS